MVAPARIKTLIRGLRLLRGLLVGGITFLVLGFWASFPTPPTFPETSSPGHDRLELKSPPPALAWYAPIWERDLKQPLVPPPPDQAPPPETTDAPVLLATLVDAQGRFAHFAGPGGRPELRGLDEGIGGFVVRSIEPGRVQLAQGDRLVWVELPKSEGRR